MKLIKFPAKYSSIINKISLPIEIWYMILKEENRQFTQRILSLSKLFKISSELSTKTKWIYMRSVIKQLENTSGKSFTRIEEDGTSRINYEDFYEYDTTVCVSLVYFYGGGYTQYIS